MNVVKKARTSGAISSTIRDRLTSLASPIVLQRLWELAVRAGVLDARFFPAPSKVFDTFVMLVKDGSLWRDTWASLQRLFWGFLVGGVPALVLGIAMGLNHSLRAKVDALVAATYPI